MHLNSSKKSLRSWTYCRFWSTSHRAKSSQLTGLGDALKSAGVLMVGITTALCHANNIKKASYAEQVMAPVLQTLLHDSYRESTGKTTLDGLELWVTEKDTTNFNYFYGILQHFSDGSRGTDGVTIGARCERSEHVAWPAPRRVRWREAPPREQGSGNFFGI